jgi:hypothetical protein
MTGKRQVGRQEEMIEINRLEAGTCAWERQYSPSLSISASDKT